MTWEEFKKLVDAQLKEKKIDANIQIRYIDTYGVDVDVSIDKETGGLCIS